VQEVQTSQRTPTDTVMEEGWAVALTSTRKTFLATAGRRAHQRHRYWWPQMQDAVSSIITLWRNLLESADDWSWSLCGHATETQVHVQLDLEGFLIA
jgi:hypothetical protein